MLIVVSIKRMRMIFYMGASPEEKNRINEYRITLILLAFLMACSVIMNSDLRINRCSSRWVRSIERRRARLRVHSKNNQSLD